MKSRFECLKLKLPLTTESFGFGLLEHIRNTTKSMPQKFNSDEPKYRK